VYVIHRRDQFRATPIFVDKPGRSLKMKFILNSTVDSVEGKDSVEKLQLNNVVTRRNVYPADIGVFCRHRARPNTVF
jgi:thioredoxin reductase (NADPH)